MIAGVGSYRIKYRNGGEFNWHLVGFSPPEGNLSLYVVCKSAKQPELLERLGKHSVGVSCLYIKRHADVYERVLEDLITSAVEYRRSDPYTKQC